MTLDSTVHNELYLSVTDGRYLLRGRHLRDQTSHNDIEVQKSQSKAFFVLVSGSKSVRIFFTALHTDVPYSTALKK